MLHLRTGFAAVTGLMALTPQPAAADVAAQLGASAAYDDNLFRQSRDLPNSSHGRSDQIYSVNGQINATVTPGDFNGRLQIDAGQNWYAQNPDLDNFNYSVRLGLQRSSLDGIGLSLTGQSERLLSSFADIRSRVRNIQELNQIDAETTVPLTPEIRLVVDPTFTQNTNSSLQVSYNDFRQYGIRAGLGLFTPLGNSVALTATRRYTDGLQPRLVLLADGTSTNSQIDVVDTSVDVKATYHVSPFTSVSAFVSYVERRDRSIFRSNYSGPAGNISITYSPRDTLSVQLTGGRRLETQSFIFVDSVKSDFITFVGYVRVAERFDLNLLADHYRRRYRYGLLVNAGQPFEIDRNYRIDADFGYRVADRLRLGIRATREWRTSTVAFGSFHASAIQASASYVFGKSVGSTINTNQFGRMAI
jgi:hypothetical protein